MLLIASCKVPFTVRKTANKKVPLSYNTVNDSTNSALLKWNQFFKDPNLSSLIDTALKNNQELNIMLQEINIANSEVLAKKGAYLPSMGIGAGAGIDKVGKFTRYGAVESNLEIAPGKEFPDPLSDLMVGAQMSWEVDVWKKLRNAKKAAISRYLSSVEGKNFMITNLIAEIANSYYELMALDNELDIVKKNIDIQSNALEIVKLEKNSAKVTELAVKRFEAEVLHTKSLQFDIQQKIIETENKINYLVGRFPQPVQRNSLNFVDLKTDSVQAGIPAQLLQNRPDIKQAEYNIMAAKLDVKSAKANFYPSLSITAVAGLQAFNAKFLLQTPQSMLYSVAGGLMAPLINRNAIKAEYFAANAKQIQAIYNYEQSVVKAYVEVANQLYNMSNLAKSYDLKSKQVQALTQSIDISTNLFKSARADYMEVLLVQRDALSSKFELVETKMQQISAMVNIYRALGGGWR